MKFTKEQIDFINAHFVPAADDNVRQIRDGFVDKGDTVWWRAEHGPTQVSGNRRGPHWYNMLNFPQLYQHEEPYVKQTFKYID